MLPLPDPRWLRVNKLKAWVVTIHESALRGAPVTLPVAEASPEGGEGGGGGPVFVCGDEVFPTAGACPAEAGEGLVSVRGGDGGLWAGSAEGDSEYVGGNSTELLPSCVEG